jgi:hypothetical protein
LDVVLTEFVDPSGVATYFSVSDSSKAVEDELIVAGQPAWSKMRNEGIHPTKAPLPNGMTMRDNVFRRNIFCYGGDKMRSFDLRNVPSECNTFDQNLVYHFGKPLSIQLSPMPAAKIAPAAGGSIGQRP